MRCNVRDFNMSKVQDKSYDIQTGPCNIQGLAESVCTANERDMVTEAEQGTEGEGGSGGGCWDSWLPCSGIYVRQSVHSRDLSDVIKHSIPLR